MAWLAAFNVIRPVLMLFGGVALLGAISNIIGGITGQNPTAQVAGTMMQTMVPMLITLMPVMMITTMMMNMMQSLTASFTQMIPSAYPTRAVI